MTTYRTVSIDGLDIFYREAGSRDHPTILLLTAFQLPLICSAISYLPSLINSISLLLTTLATATVRCLQ